MLPRMLGVRGSAAVLAPLRRIAPNAGVKLQRRGLVKPPRIGGAPLMERRADRELPGMKFWIPTEPLHGCFERRG